VKPDFPAWRQTNVNKLTEKTSTTLSLTSALSVVEECHQSTFIEYFAKLIGIGRQTGTTLSLTVTLSVVEGCL